MAYPGEIHCGDTVRWFDYLAQHEREGEVIRSAKDGTWCEVRYPVTTTYFPEVTHLTRRVFITTPHLVRNTDG